MDAQNTALGHLFGACLLSSFLMTLIVVLVLPAIGRLLRRVGHNKPISFPFRYAANRLAQEVGALLAGISIGGILFDAAGRGYDLWSVIPYLLVFVFVFRLHWAAFGHPISRSYLFLLLWVLSSAAALVLPVLVALVF